MQDIINEIKLKTGETMDNLQDNGYIYWTLSL